jgi:hypothetical protein
MIDKWDDMKLNCLCTKKEMVSKLKRLPQKGRKSLSYTSDKGLITSIYRELKRLNSPQIKTQ